MLSEAELQELRGMAFDRLLLRLWPKWDPNRASACRSCGRASVRRGLCANCYERWRWAELSGHAIDIEALPPRYGDKRYQDILLARRIGVSLDTLRQWRNGKCIPAPSKIASVETSLESEFGVPAPLWRDAVAVSLAAANRSRCTPVTVSLASGTRFRAKEDAVNDILGRQFGYWLVTGPGDRSHGIYVSAICLLCLSAKEKALGRLLSSKGGRCCRACNHRLPDWRPLGESGFKGVYPCGAKTHQGWRVMATPRPVENHFRDSQAAARYYDACMYERYGHTLFLNFPDEYDRSNDPVFVPAGEAGASPATRTIRAMRKS